MAAQLSGQTQPRSAAPAVTTPATPAGAYLQSLTISGFRPFLSHSELEAFFGSPSGLYELLASVLGLEDLALAAARLAQARKAREAELNEVKTRLPDLRAAALRHHAAHGARLASLTREIHDLSALASAEVARRDDKWAPVAGEVTSWCANAVKALDGMAPVNMIKAADKWLKGATDAIRNERLAPLAEQAGVRPRTRWAQWPVPALGR